MATGITYGELYDKLRQLGFGQRELRNGDNPQYVFEHKTIDNAMIVLPQRDRKTLVESFYMGSALATLKAHHLLPESNPLAT